MVMHAEEGGQLPSREVVFDFSACVIDACVTLKASDCDNAAASKRMQDRSYQSWGTGLTTALDNNAVSSQDLT